MMRISNFFILTIFFLAINLRADSSREIASLDVNTTSNPLELSKTDASLLRIRPKRKPALWIHTDDKNSVLAACRFIPKLLEVYEDVPILVTTTSFEEKSIIDTFCVGPNIIKLLMHDDINIISDYCQRMNVAAILILDKNITENMLLFSYLKKIPIYLFDVNYSYAMRAKIERDPFLYADLFNYVPQKIYIKKQDNQEFFKKIGVEERHIVYGDLDAFGVKETKEAYCKVCNIDDKKLKEMFPHPFIFFNIVEPGSIDDYWRIFKKLKELYPSLKVAFAQDHAGIWIEELKLKLDLLGEHYSFLDDVYRDFIHLDNKVFDKLKNEYDNHDFFITTKARLFFFLHAIASIYLIEGRFEDVKTMNFMESAAWSNVIAIGKLTGEMKNDIHNNDEESSGDDRTSNFMDQKIIKEIAITVLKGETDSVDKIAFLIEEGAPLAQHSYYGLQKVAQATSKEIDNFIEQLSYILQENFD